MATLKYYVYLTEDLVDKSGDTQCVYERSLPHHVQIAEWLPKEWAEINPLQYFPAELREIIDSCEMTVYQNSMLQTMAVVSVKAKAGVHWSKRTRAMVFRNLKASLQMDSGKPTIILRSPALPITTYSDSKEDNHHEVQSLRKRRVLRSPARPYGYCLRWRRGILLRCPQFFLGHLRYREALRAIHLHPLWSRIR